MTERYEEGPAAEEKLSRRSLVARATFFGAAMAAIGDVAKAQDAGSGSYSNAAIALPDSSVVPKTREEQIRAVRIARAMRAGPRTITEHATVAEMDKQGRMTDILREGTNDWVACPATKMSSAIHQCVSTHWACSGSRICLRGSHSRPIRRRGFVICFAAQRSAATRTPMTERALPYRLAPTGRSSGPSTPTTVASRRQSETRARGSCLPGRPTLICTFAGRLGLATNIRLAMKRSGQCGIKSEPLVDAL